jgi:hypothetical protein
MVSALKPRGNPLAAGRAGAPRREDGVTARLRDLGGRPANAARLSLFTGITAAHPISLVEDAGAGNAGAGNAGAGDSGPGVSRTENPGPRVSAPAGPPLPLRDGQAEAVVPVAGTVTLGLSVPGQAALPPPGSGTAPEPAQPVFTRYWLHGKGPAPAGNLPVAVHLSPARVALPGAAVSPDDGAGDTAVVRLTVACGPEPASGVVDLDVPAGLAATPDAPLRYDLPALGHAHWDLAVRGAAGAPPGHYFLAARIGDELGQILEDATAVTLGGPPGPGAAMPRDFEAGDAQAGDARPRDVLLAALEADLQAVAAELEVSMLTPEVRVRPGGTGELAVRVANRAASPVRGEAQLISPFGSWRAVHPWTRGFSVSPGKVVTLRYHVRVPITARRGTQWWTMVKLMYFGRLRYTSSVPVLICE